MSIVAHEHRRAGNSTSMSNLKWPIVDRTPWLYLEGYRFAERRRRHPDEDATPMRLAGSKALLVRGDEAVRFFYTDPALQRADAIPQLIAGPLFGPGAVHALDGTAHEIRKGWFNTVLDGAAVQDVVKRVDERWRHETSSWRGEVDLFDRASRVLFEAATDWAGFVVPLGQLDRRLADMVAMVDGFGGAGPRRIRSLRARSRSQAWARSLVRQAREHGATGVLEQVATARDDGGELWDLQTAATELLNLVRPQVAVAWLVCGGARGLDGAPMTKAAVRSGSINPLDLAQEARRTTPFVPVLAARAHAPTRWGGFDVEPGTLVVLDVWGTDQDARTWERPDVFDPSRFRSELVTANNLVPQGGHVRDDGHRCPGEDLTLALLATMLPRLAELDLDVTTGRTTSLRRMPPTPHCDVLVRPQTRSDGTAS